MSVHKLKMIFFFNEKKAEEYERNNNASVWAIEYRGAIQMLFGEQYEKLKKIIWE